MECKTMRWICLAALILGILPLYGWATVFFDENLEATPLGPVSSSTATHNGGSWVVTTPVSTAAQVINDPTGTGNGKILECQDNGTYGLKIFTAPSSPGGDNVTWSFDFYNFAGGYHMEPQCGYANGTSVLFGQFWYSNGSVTNYSYAYATPPAYTDYYQSIAPAGTLPVSTWCHVILTFRHPTVSTYASCDLTVTRKSDGAVLLNQTNLPGQNAGLVNDPNYYFARFGFISPGWAHFYLDNIRLATPATADPSISPASGSYPSAQTVTLSCQTSGATIRYTTDGADPAADNTTGTIYTGSFVVNGSVTVKARAFAPGLDPSLVVIATYTIGQVLFSENLESTPLGAISSATATHNGGSWVVTTPASTAAQVINDPTGAGNGKILECQDNGTYGLKIFSAPSSPCSDNATWSFDFYNFAGGYHMEPQCGYANGTSVLFDQFWKADGSVTNYSYAYATPPNYTDYYQSIAPAGTLPVSTWCHAVLAFRHPATVNAYASCDLTVTRKSDGAVLLSQTNLPGKNMGSPNDPNFNFARFGFTSPGWAHFYLDNIHLSATPVTGDPTLSPTSGTYLSAQTVTLACPTSGASIRYTTDGTDPVDNGTGILYNSPIAINRTTTVKARAFAAGMYPSGIISATYTIGQVVFDENLEATPLGPIDNSTATHNGGSWVVTTPAGTAAQVISDPTGAGYGRILECQDNGTSGLKIFASPSSPRSDNVTWTFDFYNFPGGYHMEPKCSFANGTSTIFQEFWYADGTVSNWSYSYATPPNYTDYFQTIAPAGTLASGTWYHVVLAMRQPAASYTYASCDLTVTRKSDGAVVLNQTNLPGLNTGILNDPNYYFARFGFTSPGWAHFYLDNIHVAPSPATADPVFSPSGGTFNIAPQTISLGGPAGASIRYTLDGTDPVDNGTGILYTGAFNITQTTTVRARAFASGMYPSGTVAATFRLVARTPTFSPGTGYYSSGKSVTISSPGSSAIYYTTDGSTPTTGSTLYTGSISVGSRTTLKAMAAATGLGASDTGTADYYFPNQYNRPVAIPEGSPSVDGDLSDWPAFPGSGWTPIDKPYYPDNTTWPSDIPHDGASAYYAAQWDSNTIYLAVRVRDTAHVFSHGFGAWNTHDAVEIHLHTTGWSQSPVGYDATDADAQHYVIGFDTDNVSLWKVVSGGAIIPPVWMNVQAVGNISGQWLQYEVAITPYQYLNLNSQAASAVSPLSLGDVIGLDPVVSAYTGTAFGMIAENQMASKANDFTALGLHVLAPSAYGSADLAAMLAAMDSSPTSSNWNPTMDLDGDGTITSSDLSIMLANMQ